MIVSLSGYVDKSISILKKHFFSDVRTATMKTAFNDKSFKLDKNLSDLGLQVFRPIEERNCAFDERASPSPPLPGVATNAPHDFIESSYDRAVIHRAAVL